MIGRMGRYFHVTSTANRASINEHGLDSSRMGAARGIAGSCSPEADGCFLVDNEWEVDWFIQMNNTGGDVDVWAIENVDATKLVDNGRGHYYMPGPIARDRLVLVRNDLPPVS
jgi:hypothetical protein